VSLRRALWKQANLGVVNKNQLCAILLTGGASRRMGQDKAFLPLGKLPLWAAVAQQVAPICSQLFVLHSPEQNLDPTALSLPPGTEVHYVCDPELHQGPLYALAQLSARLTLPWSLVLSTDLPFLTADFLADLLQLSDQGNTMVAQNGGKQNPLLALYPTAQLQTAPALWAAGRQDAKALLEGQPVVSINDRPEARGINRIEGYHSALAELGKP